MVFNGFGGNHHQLMFFVLCSDGGIVTIVNILEEVLVVIEMVVDQQVDGKVLIHKVYNIPPPGLYFGNGFNVRNPSDWRKKKEKHRHRRNVMSYRFKSLFKLFSLFSLL